MKKKLLLAVLPALLVLASCSAQPNAKAEPIFQEDTLAHEEIFGEADGFELRAPKRNLDSDPYMADRAQPAIGVQYQENGENISIRFVAAIDIGTANLADVSAVWHRILYWSDGSVGKADAPKESLKAYTSLNNKGSIYSIDDFNGASGTYDYFVVYTLLNVKKSDYQYCRLNAYLELNSGASYSKVLSTTIGGGYRFTFDRNDSGYFLAGKINGVENAVVKQHSPTLGNNNQASFIADIQSNDMFFVVHKGNNYFGVKGGSDLGGTSDFSESEGMIKAGNSGNYAFYFSNDGKVYPSGALVTGNKGFYVRGDAAKGWDDLSLQLHQDNWENLMLIENVELSANKEFKIGTNNWSSEYNWNHLLDSSKSNFEEGSGGNIKVKDGCSGTYNIYITINELISIAKVA